MNALIEKTTDSHWNGLYEISGIATIVMMVFFLFDIIVWSILGPYPSSAEDWFMLLQKNRHVGLLLLSFPTFFGTMLYYLTFLGLYHILKQVNSAYAALAALLAFVGLTILVVTHIAYPIIYLCDRYAATTQEAQRALLLMTAETKLVTSATGLNMGGFFAEGAAVIFSLLMLQSDIFGKKTAYLGILGHGLDFVRIIMNLAFLPEGVGAILLMIGGLPQLIWLSLVAGKFLRLGQSQSSVSQAT